MKSNYFVFLLLLTISSCLIEPNEPVEVMGMQPVYLTDSDSIIVASQPPQNFTALGKIVYVAPYLYINDRFKGVHVIDNSDLDNPQKIAFLRITGNIDFTIKDDLLYADNGRDLYVINIADINNVIHVNTIKNIYTDIQSDYLVPPEFDGFFECVDSTRGHVIDWKEVLLIDPKCFK